MSEMTWIRVTECENIPLREGRAIQVGDREVAIFNLGDRFLAVENRCPHRNGPLADGIVSGTSIVCPLHAWKFSLETGQGMGGPAAASCVEAFPTRVEHDVILLALPVEACKQQMAVFCAEGGTEAWNDPGSAVTG